MREVDLLVFAKAPRPGRVKTRLVPPLTPSQAAAVHEASLRDVVARARRVGARLRIVYDGVPGARAYFARAFPEVAREPQVEGDLGRRMAGAFAARFAAGAAQVVAIGADSPTLPGSYLARGLAATREAGGALGPAADGGYYLIGVRRELWPAAETLFAGVPWSTGRVLEVTLERAATAGIPLRLLPRWYDVDRPDDLRRARGDAREDSHLARLLDARGIATPSPGSVPGRGVVGVAERRATSCPGSGA